MRRFRYFFVRNKCYITEESYKLVSNLTSGNTFDAMGGNINQMKTYS